VVPDLFAARPVLVHGRYHHSGSAEVRIHGRIRGQAWTRAVHVTLPERAQDHEALPAVWARARIHDLGRAMFLGETPALRDEVTQLGLQFALVTDYTSFVAIDDAGTLTAACRGRVPASSGGTIGYGSLGAAGYAYGAGSAAMGSLNYGTSVGSSMIERLTAAPMVRAATPVVMGMASPDALRATIHRHLPEIQSCYSHELNAHPQLAGRVTLRFVIGIDGGVLAVAVAEDSLGSSPVSECLVRSARAWSFPETPGDSVITMTYPFVFTPPDPETIAPSPTRFVVPIARE
jgi:hypothetical protein